MTNCKTETTYGMEQLQQLNPKSVEVVDSGVIGKESVFPLNKASVSSRQYAILKCTFEAEVTKKTYCKYYMVVSMQCLAGSYEGGAAAALQVVELPSFLSELEASGPSLPRWSTTDSTTDYWI